MDNKKEIAYHEAGHAVIASRLVFVSLGSISILPDIFQGKRFDGIFRGGYAIDSGDEFNSAEMEIIVRLAGMESELRINQNFEKVKVTASDDYKEAKCIFKKFKDDIKYTFDELKEKAAEMVKDNLSLIDIVANILMEEKTISKNRLTEIIEDFDYNSWKLNNKAL